MSWVRLWSDMPTDPKWRTIAKRSGQRIGDVIAVFNILLIQGGANAIERGRTHGNDDDDIAAALDLESDDVAAIRKAMQGKVLDGDHLTGWEKRQPKREDGDAAQRAKDWRERKKAEREQDANATERTRTQSHVEERPEAEAEADADADSEVGVAKATQPLRGFHVPDDIPREPWDGFIEMRKRKRAPATDRAKGGIVKKLRALAEAGHPPGEVLDQSTRNSWTDVYPLKEDHDGQHRQHSNGAGGKVDGFGAAIARAERATRPPDQGTADHDG